MAKRQPKQPQPTWSDVKRKLATADQATLLNLLHDLYAASPDNRDFLNVRLGLVENILEAYKEQISRWLWPDVYRGQELSVAKAKQVITDYKKAIGREDPAGLAELQTYYCEQASGFSDQFGYQDSNFFSSLVRVFAQAAATASTLPSDLRAPLLARLEEVRDLGQNFGYFVGDQMGDILAEFLD